MLKTILIGRHLRVPPEHVLRVFSEFCMGGMPNTEPISMKLFKNIAVCEKMTGTKICRNRSISSGTSRTRTSGFFGILYGRYA